MRLRKNLKGESNKRDTREYKEKVQIDNKGRLYIDIKDLAQSPVFRQQLANAAKIRVQSE